MLKKQELAKIFNLQNIANGKKNFNDEAISNKEYLYKTLFEKVNFRKLINLKTLRKFQDSNN